MLTSGWGLISLPKHPRLLLCSLRLNSVLSESKSWEAYAVLNSLVDLLDAWMVFRASLNSLLSSELDASAGAFSRKMDSCEGRKMGCSQIKTMGFFHLIIKIKPNKK